MMRSVAVFALAFFCATSATTFFQESFEDASWTNRWVISDAKKSEGTAGEWKLKVADWYGDKVKDQGISTSQDARFYSMTAKFNEAFDNKDKDLVLQFQVQFPQKIDCGGGYIKLLPSSVNQKDFSGDSPYFIMFGPDICGTSTRKTHVIFNYKDDNHLIQREIRCETDQLSHVYTLIVHPDNTYEVRIDGESKQTGSLEDDWGMLPDREIDDPTDVKPDDWVDNEMMDDPEDTKPDNWDDIPEYTADPEAEKPDDWDDDEDGEWEAPQIRNPEFKGAWKAKQIPNPEYKGVWKPKKMPNPEFVEDPNLYRYENIGAIGFELWQVKSGSIFTNIIVTDSVEEAEALVDEWKARKDAEKTMFDDIQDAKRKEEEEERKKAEEARKRQEEADESVESEEDVIEDEDELEHDEL